MIKRHLWILLVLLVAVIIYLVVNPRIKVQERVQERVVYQPRECPVQKQPEFRNPPYKKYKPTEYQQMGLLISDSETLPLYGRFALGYSDRWNYYTTTPGNQMYSLPVSHEDRDCTEDMGCREFYGNEDVTVTGKNGAYKTKIYRTTFG